LRDAIEWSYDLLDDDIKRLFRALSVFVGGCTLEAAEIVCGWTTNDGRRTTDNESDQLKTHSVLSPHSSVLDGLAALADRSMIKYEEQEDGEPRFSMLETIREYAMERLEEAGSIDGGEAKDIRRLHAEYYLSLAEEAESHLTGPEQLAWTNRIETEHDNVRAALSTTLLKVRGSSDRGTSDLTFDAPNPLLEWTGLRLAGAIWQFWAGRGYLAEGRRWLQLALDAAQRLHDSGSDTLGDAEIGFRALAGAQLKALNGMGVLARLAGDFPAARQALEDGLKIAVGISDQRAVANTLNNLGTMAMMRGDYTDARGFLEECLAIKRELGLELEAGHSLTQLGNVAMMEGNYAEARRLHEEGLVIKRREGDMEGIGHSLHSLANIARREGDYAEARRLNEETLGIARELGNKQGIAYSLRDLGNVECEQGDYEGARKSLRESLAMFRELENLMPTVECLIGIARVSTHIRQAEYAARLLGAAHTTLEATEGQLDPPDRAAFERDLGRLRAQLSEEAFTVAWEYGKTLTLEEAIALALEESPTASPTSSLMAGAPATRAALKPEGGPTFVSSESALTPREIEVLQLVAAGLTNPGIASHLNLSIGTVQTHMSSIFSKVNVNTRAAAVRYAFEHSLV
jgi:DNA-binding CsgD family transcriptional regulator/tetratricopeptide (TPR) repeat protein